MKGKSLTSSLGHTHTKKKKKEEEEEGQGPSILFKGTYPLGTTPNRSHLLKVPPSPSTAHWLRTKPLHMGL
jgi:hypothetical protein